MLNNFLLLHTVKIQISGVLEKPADQNPLFSINGNHQIELTTESLNGNKSATLFGGKQSSRRKPGSKVIKLFSCSTQLSMKFQLLINVKMPTIVGILTVIRMINTTYERLKAKHSLLVGILVFMSS